MKFPNKEYIEELRKKYPVGTKIQLISMWTIVNNLDTKRRKEKRLK